MENDEPLIIVNPVNHTVHKTPPVHVDLDDMADEAEQEAINKSIDRRLGLAVRDPI